MKTLKDTASRHPALTIIVFATLVAFLFISTRPTAKKRPSRTSSFLVETKPLEQQDYRPTFDAFGQVQPVTSITLRNQVAGVIVKRHDQFVPGGFIPANETIVFIDNRDYVARLDQAVAELKIAKEELNLEEGLQRISAAEWTLTESPTQTGQHRDLATRGPQLRSRQAAVRRAQAEVELAKLNLERSNVTLPFDAFIETTTLGVGSLAAQGSHLGDAFAAHAFWIVAKLAVDKLKWLDTSSPDNVLLTAPDGSTATATIQTILTNVEADGLMGQVLIEIPTAGAGEKSLPVSVNSGTYFDIQLRGRPIKNAVVLSRTDLHDGNLIYIMDKNNTLEIRRISPLVKDRSAVVVATGIDPGEILIQTNIPAPVEGMTVQVLEAETIRLRPVTSTP